MQAVALALVVAFSAGQTDSAVAETPVEAPAVEQPAKQDAAAESSDAPVVPPNFEEPPKQEATAESTDAPVVPPNVEEPPKQEATPESSDAPAVPPPESKEPPKVENRPGGTFRAPPPNLYLKPPKASQRVARIGVEFLMSILGELSGGLAGSMVGCATVEYGPQGCLLGFLFGALIGAVVGVPAGVAIGGLVMDGNGSVPATVVGALAGIGISAILIGAVTYNLNGSSALAILSGIGFLLMPNIISILAYELTSDTSRRYIEATTPPKVTLVPTIDRDRFGAALAVSF